VTRQATRAGAAGTRRTPALFAGPDSAGKLAALAALSRETGAPAYRIDLPAVVRKYIGETEKNISRLFEDAEAIGAILFFDEADALFGKRSEVKDAHDRYANLEVGYLLGRIDAYHGIVILATNRRDAPDDAIVRRVRMVIDFPIPEAKHPRT
jgi:SpoVK/Ycf46/Vps4 family AAA+-type ATPase